MRRVARAKLLTVALAIVAVVALTGCWLEPGSDAEQSGYNPFESGITPANVARLHPTWTKQLVGSVNAPAVDTDGVFVSSGGYPDGGTLALVQRADGSTRWSSPLFGANSGLDVGPPTVLGSTVYVPAPGVSAIIGSSIPGFDATTGATRPAIAQHTFAAIGRGSLVVGTGAQGNSSGIAASQLFVADTVGTGSWSTYVDISGISSFPVPTSPAVGSTRLFIGRGTTVQSWPLAKPTNCTVTSGVTICPPAWSTTTGAPAGHPVLSADGTTVYAGAGTNLVALSAATGGQSWSGTLGATASAAPAIGSGFVYVPTSSGELDVFAAAGCGQTTCAPLWTANTASFIRQAPVVVSGGLVYLASDDGVVRAYPSAGCGHPTCASLWSAATGSTITGGPVPALGNLYVGTADGRLIAFGL